MTADKFTPHVATVFTIVAGEERREIVLDRVETRPELARGAKNQDGSDFFERVPFSLVFSGPREELFGQALFEIRHVTLGTMQLFVKPFTADDEKAYYEAVFC